MHQIAEVEIEVRYAETDQMGVVHHRNHLVWFELARTKLCELSGWSYPAIEELGFYLMLRKAAIDYRHAARYGDRVQARSWISILKSRTVDFAYEIHRDGTLLATGTTQHLWVAKGSNSPCRIPPVLEDPFRSLLGKDPANGRMNP